MRREPVRDPARPTPMRCSLGTLAAGVLTGLTLTVTAACGSSSSTVATEPGSGGPADDPAGNPSRTPGAVVGATVLPLISMTGGGGRPSTTAVALGSPGNVAKFLAQFNQPPMRRLVSGAIANARRMSDRDVYGQVVAVGCDRPPGVDTVVDQDGEVQLRPRPVASPLEECLAPVTTVAIAQLPQT